MFGTKTRNIERLWVPSLAAAPTGGLLDTTLAASQSGGLGVLDPCHFLLATGAELADSFASPTEMANVFFDRRDCG